MTRWDAIECIAFDFDGTLVESNAIKRSVYFEILAHVPGSEVAIERVLRALPGADRHAVLARVHLELASRSGLPGVEDLIAAYSRLCEERVAICPALPGAVEALEALAPSHALYLDSATPTEALARVVALRGWQDRFKAVLGAPASKHENLERIGDREALAPTQILYVGDGSADREAAVSFGCRFLGYHAPAGDLRDHTDLGVLAALVDEIAQRSR